jgi:hypothetical protein
VLRVPISGRVEASGTHRAAVTPGGTCRARLVVQEADGTRLATANELRALRVVDALPNAMTTWSSGWTRRARTTAVGGSVRAATAAGRWVRHRFTGDQIALVMGTGPGRGRVRVRIDGQQVATLDLRSWAASGRRVVFARRLAPGTHVVEVRVVARNGRAPGRVELDGFVVTRP